MESGPATGYSLENLQARGTLFVSPMDPVYTGMIVGEHSRSGDLACNPTKTKKLGNYRAETKEIDVGLKVPRQMTLDQALEWIADDELVEVTPKTVRVRKAVLDAEERKRANRTAGRRRARSRRTRHAPPALAPTGRYCSAMLITTVSPSRSIHQGIWLRCAAPSGGNSVQKLLKTSQLSRLLHPAPVRRRRDEGDRRPP